MASSAQPDPESWARFVFLVTVGGVVAWVAAVVLFIL